MRGGEGLSGGGPLGGSPSGAAPCGAPTTRSPELGRAVCRGGEDPRPSRTAMLPAPTKSSRKAGRGAGRVRGDALRPCAAPAIRGPTHRAADGHLSPPARRGRRRWASSPARPGPEWPAGRGRRPGPTSSSGGRPAACGHPKGPGGARHRHASTPRSCARSPAPPPTRAARRTNAPAGSSCCRATPGDACSLASWARNSTASSSAGTAPTSPGTAPARPSKGLLQAPGRRGARGRGRGGGGGRGGPGGAGPPRCHQGAPARPAGVDRLVELILGLAESDPVLLDRLDLAASAASGAPEELAARCRTALRRALRTGGFVDYARAGGWVRRVLEVFERVEALVGAGHAHLGLCRRLGKNRVVGDATRPGAAGDSWRVSHPALSAVRVLRACAKGRTPPASEADRDATRSSRTSFARQGGQRGPPSDGGPAWTKS